MKKSIISLLSFALFFTLAGDAHAFKMSYSTCNGDYVSWRTYLKVTRNRCTIPETGPVNDMFWSGINRWNELAGRRNPITGQMIPLIDEVAVTPAPYYLYLPWGRQLINDCSIQVGDGINEVALVDPTSIDSNSGMTWPQAGACFIGANDLDESDMVVNKYLLFARGFSGEDTFVHEMGHFLGFDHTYGFSVMYPGTPPDTAIENDFIKSRGLITPATLWPTDVQGLHSVYGVKDARPNLKVAAYGPGIGHDGLDAAPWPPPTYCRGSTISTRFYIGNAGATGVSSFPLKLSLVDIQTAASYDVGQWIKYNTPAYSDYMVESLPFRIPTVPMGYYYIRYALDHTNSIAEYNESDNVGYGGTSILVGNCQL